MVGRQRIDVPSRITLILVVDDDMTTNERIQAILTRAGFKTTAAFDVAGALDEIHERHPDLILLDVSLPDGRVLPVERGNLHIA